MFRQSGTNESNGGFDDQWIEAVWNKATVVPGYDPTDYRKDACGAWIRRQSYGTVGDWGWEIDHITPISFGGTDDFTNLQPLHWQNNRGKGDSHPNWSCTISAAA